MEEMLFPRPVNSFDQPRSAAILAQKRLPLNAREREKVSFARFVVALARLAVAQDLKSL
jgi:hypothetical protein